MTDYGEPPKDIVLPNERVRQVAHCSQWAVSGIEEVDGRPTAVEAAASGRDFPVNRRMRLAAQCRWTVPSGMRRIEVAGATRSGSWGCASEGREGGLMLHDVTPVMLHAARRSHARGGKGRL